jgi:signal transduction histidine kinase
LSAEKYRILIIEDSVTYQQALKRAFEAKGYAVTCASRGEEGLEAVRKQKPDLMIVDLMLPGIDGREVCRNIKMNMNYRHIPIMMLTFQKEDKAVIEGVEAGADNYVNKSEPMEVILKRAESLIRLSRAAGPILDEGGERDPEILLTDKDVLLVDDDVTFLYNTARLLGVENYKVRTALSGEECFDRLREKVPDILLLDLRMPDIDGADVCRQIRKIEKFSDLPVVILTVSDSPEDIIRCFEAGANDYVLKTTDFKLVKLRIYSILRRKHFERETRRIREKLTDAETRAIVADAEKEAEKKFAAQLAEKNKQLEALYAELEKKNKDLGRLNELKSDFVGMVSHELRTPMAIIKEAVSQILEGLLGDITPEQRHFLDMTLESVNRLERIINDLLDISKIEAGKIELNKEPLNLARVAEHVVQGFQLKAQEKGIEIKAVFSSPEIEVLADGDKMVQVFTNLIANALKFTEQGSVTVSVREMPDHIECRVQDTGPGIPPEDLIRVFEKFEQVKSHQKKGVKGTGLGLPIVNGLVAMHHGKIWVESEVGKGSAFVFTLPKSSIKDFFTDVLSGEIKNATRRSEKMAVAVLISAEYGKNGQGPDAGRNRDEMMKCKKAIARTLRNGNDKVLYYGGSFLLLLSKVGREDALGVLGRVDDAIRLHAGDSALSLEKSMVVFPEDGATAEELLKRLGIG